MGIQAETTTEPSLLALPSFRLPHYPAFPLTLDAQPLCIINTAPTAPPIPTINTTIITPALGVATILHAWHPTALTAFLDLDAWFSLTWSLTTPTQCLEIGRIGRKITFGTLAACGEKWELMLTFDMAGGGGSAHGGAAPHPRGTWIPNAKESMQGARDVVCGEEIKALAVDWVRGCVAARVWETGGRGVTFRFWVEYAPMDVWGDGIPMAPGWLYASLDLGRCSACGVQSGTEVLLQRCGRCGTAAYCGDVCQRGDWKVHKFICTMKGEERGQALKISENGGLIGWDVERMFAEEGSGVESSNCNLPEGVLKRVRRRRTRESGLGSNFHVEDAEVQEIADTFEKVSVAKARADF